MPSPSGCSASTSSRRRTRRPACSASARSSCRSSGPAGSPPSPARSAAGTTTTATSRASTSSAACCASSSRASTGHLDAQAGDFVHVPAFTVHRESNPTDEPSIAVIARAGGGIPTVNVDPPQGVVGEPDAQEVVMTFRSLRLAPAVAILGLGLPFLPPRPRPRTPRRVVLPTLTSVQAQHVGEGRPGDVRLHQRATCRRPGHSGSTPCTTTARGCPCGWPARRS